MLTSTFVSILMRLIFQYVFHDALKHGRLTGQSKHGFNPNAVHLTVRPRFRLNENRQMSYLGSADLPLIQKIRPLGPLALTLFKRFNILQSLAGGYFAAFLVNRTTIDLQNWQME